MDLKSGKGFDFFKEELKSPPQAPFKFILEDAEREQLLHLARRLMLQYGTVANKAFLRSIALHTAKLPRRFYKMLSAFGNTFGKEHYGAVCIQNFVDVDQVALGSTPLTYEDADPKQLELYAFATALVHFAVGAYMVQMIYQRGGGGDQHSVIPDLTRLDSQTGSGSRTPLGLHNEDAQLLGNAQFITFLWLRNNEQANSNLFSIRSLDVAKLPYADVLRKPIFKMALDGNYANHPSLERVPNRKIPILYGNKLAPFMRVDFAEMLADYVEQTPEALEALLAFKRDAERLTYSSFVPKAGDLLLINNWMVAHGRSAFHAGYFVPKGVVNKADWIPVEKRWMLRMMSIDSLARIHEYTTSAQPRLSREIHSGLLAPPNF